MARDAPVSRPSPDVEEATAVMAIGAAAGAGDADALVEALEAARELVDPDDVEEYLLQTYLFAGFPRTINAFFTWQGWANDNGGRGAIVMEPDEMRIWRERGEDLCRLVYSGTYEALQMRMARLHPAIADWTVVEGYGKVLSRPGPDAPRRELAAVGALIVLDVPRQLDSHLQGALHAGVEREVLETAARSVAARWRREEPVETRLERLEAP